MNQRVTARALLHTLASQRVIARDLDHLLAVERLLGVAYAERWPSERLAGSIASIVASSPAQWEQVHRHLLDHLEPEHRVSTEPPLGARLREHVSAQLERSTARWAQRSAAAWLAGIAGALVLTSLGVVAVVKWTGDEVAAIVEDEPAGESTSSSTSTTGGGEVLPGDPTPVVEVDEPTLLPSDAPPITITLEDTPVTTARPSPPWLLVALAGISASLAALGLAWLRAPTRYRALVRSRADAVLEQRKTQTPEDIAYHVERFPPFDAGRMDGTASLLARLGTDERGLELDVAASLRCTLERGLPTPVMLPTHAARELLILVDVEHGDHPFLDGVNWLLERWRRGGLAFVRYDFAQRPDAPRHWPDAIETTIELLARRSEGMPLLLFSRGRALAFEFQTLAPWLAFATAWPKRVFVDLDPRMPEARTAHARRELDTLREHGFVRVPFTPDGLDAAALHLAGRSSSSVQVETPLRPLAAVEPAIRRWVAAAACVPDANWRQLEAIRRHFLDLREALPDPRYLQHALDWVQRELAAKLEPSKGGKRLDLGRLAVDLRSAQDEAFVHEAIELVLRQIEAANPNRAPLGLASLRVARLRALLEPERADELLRPFIGTAWDIELRDVVAEVRASAGSQAVLDERLTNDPSQVPVHELGVRGLGVWSGAVGLLVAGAAIGLWWWTTEVPELGPTISEVRTPRDVVLRLPGTPPPSAKPLPPECDFTQPLVAPPLPTGGLDAPATGVKCETELALADTAAPMRLVRLSGGEFTMGSPDDEEGRFTDETRHRVALSRFAMCATEVSAKQYELVMGERPFKGDADDHPARSVSWQDALRFMNALTRRENANRPANAQLTPCYDEKSGAWDVRCTGYRLPTEAEWEYAARAGSTTRWWFGDDETQLCKYANVSTSLCDDGFEDVAPVETNRLSPNPWGLHAVYGNVWEWVFDAYGPYSRVTAINPIPPPSLDDRILRGGSFRNWSRLFRSANRGKNPPLYRSMVNGFRCARGAVPSLDLPPRL